jgi:fused signal recognition particle receptor
MFTSLKAIGLVPGIIAGYGSIIKKWKEGLAKTSKATFGQIATLLEYQITDETFEELEALLIKSIWASKPVIRTLWELLVGNSKTSNESILHRNYRTVWLNHIRYVSCSTYCNLNRRSNGLAKPRASLGKHFSGSGKQVILGAADTFRITAVDRLQIWADRVNLPCNRWTTEWRSRGRLLADQAAGEYDLAIIDTGWSFIRATG